MAFNRRETLILLVGDFVILIASLWVALLLRNLALPSFSYFRANLLPFLPVFFLSLIVFYIAGLYEKQTRPIRSVMGIRIFGAQAATAAIAAILFFILPLSIAPKTILVLYLVVSVIAESAWRFHRMTRETNEENRTPAVLIGEGPSVMELYEEVQGNDRYMICFTKHIDLTHLHKEEVVEAITQARRDGMHLFVLDTSSPKVGTDMLQLSDRTRGGITFVEFASLYEEIFDRVPLEQVGAEQLLRALPERRSLYDAAKRIFDIVLALPLFIIAIPFILFGAVGRAMTRTPVFVPHERVGKGGKNFIIIKLGSMWLNDHGDPELRKKNYVTRFGMLLRKTRIDELPQLWNVIRGDLSFIGPRPELPNLVEIYEHEISQYRMRHLITPGLSGWAQIHDYNVPRGSADVGLTRRKLSFDLYYLKHRSFGLDLAIAVKTLRALLSFSGT